MKLLFFFSILFSAANSFAQTANATNTVMMVGPQTSAEKIILECESTPSTLNPKCEVLKSLGGNSLESFSLQETTKFSTDKKIRCQKFASYTIDYERCLRIKNMYDSIIVTEKALDFAHAFYQNKKATEISKELEEMQGKGDIQLKGIESQIESLKQKKQHADQKLAAFKTATATLGAAVSGMPGLPKAFSLCEEKSVSSPKVFAQCRPVIKSFSHQIVPNLSNRPFLIAAGLQYAKKVMEIQQGIRMIEKQIADLESMKEGLLAQSSENGTDLMVDVCLQNPQDPVCLSKEQKVSVTPQAQLESAPTFQAAGLVTPSMTAVGPSTSFEENNSSASSGDNSLNDERVADVESHLEDEVAKANDILSPAAPASAKPGGDSGHSGGASGPGGSPGGGGSASLGNDLSAPEEEKKSDIKISEVSVGGSGKKKKGVGFSVIASSKKNSKEENPFASLFDEKEAAPQGGVELEREVASLDTKDSKLFKKISSRYQKIIADKRIEAMNLED